MGLFGALFTSVSGAQAQSQQTALISDNIANVSSVGFKRTDASFRSLVTTQSAIGRFSPGSVISDRQLRATEQGALRQTNSATDVAISGNGFFVVRSTADAAPDQEFLYTRNGQFFEDEQGFLRNTAGFVLYGVPIVEAGVTPDFSDLSQLEPVDATTISQNARVTTRAELAINLNSQTRSFNNDIDAPNPPTQLPTPITGGNALATDFTRTLPVFDSLGTAQELVFDFRKVLGPQANATFNIQNVEDDDILSGNATVPGALPGIVDGDEITLQALDLAGIPQPPLVIRFESDPANPAAVPPAQPVTPGAVVVQTLQDLINAVNDYPGLELRRSFDDDGLITNDELILQATHVDSSIEINAGAGNLGTPLTSNGLNLIGDRDSLDGSNATAQFIERSAGNLVNDAPLLPTDPLDLTQDFVTNSGFSFTGGEVLTFDVTDTTGTTLSYSTPPIASPLTLDAFITQVNVGLAGVGITDISVTISPDGRLQIQKSDPLVDVQLSGTATTTAGGQDFRFTDNLSAGEAQFVFEPEAPIRPTNGLVYGANDPYPQQDDFPAFGATNIPNTQGWWEVTITQPNGNQVTRGLINFASDATLNATPDANDEVNITLSGIDFGNGSDPGQVIEVDIERFSSFAGANNVIFSDQNGAEVGLRTGVEVTNEGVVVARFSNGTTAELFQIPLATFANANGLGPRSGTTFSETENSGEENLNAPGAGGAGLLEPSTLEQSNVDLADQFALLIITQRAYTANTRTINTVDELTEELLRLR